MDNPYQTPETNPTLPTKPRKITGDETMRFSDFRYPLRYYINYSKIHAFIEVSDANGKYVLSSRPEFSGHDCINIYNHPEEQTVTAYFKTNFLSRKKPSGLYRSNHEKLGTIIKSSLFPAQYQLINNTNNIAVTCHEHSSANNLLNKILGSIWGLRAVANSLFKTRLTLHHGQQTDPAFTLQQLFSSRGKLYTLEKYNDISEENEYLFHVTLAHLILVNNIR